MELQFPLQIKRFFLIIVGGHHRGSIMLTKRGFLLFGFLVIWSSLASAGRVPSNLNRNSFPDDFIFGTAAASYQYEGAVMEDGKGQSIWDNFTHQYPGRILDGSNADVTVDFYHRYKEDVNIMKNMGLDAFRFSISWSRILPRGKINGGVNQKGVQFYNNLINDLLSEGIKPFVTLFHWDLPQALEDEYGGFLSPRIVDDFRDYAELCFKEFGDRVKHWITINEPWSYSTTGYDSGIFAPGRCSIFKNAACSAGNSSTEPYLVAHNSLISHAVAVKLYKEKFQQSQKGNIGITLVSHWMEPYSTTKPNNEAAKRSLDFMLGWFMDPLTYGDYPFSMQSLVGQRLPKFTDSESKLVKGSFDFIGINYYTAFYASSVTNTNKINLSYSTDSLVNLTNEKNGIPIGPMDGSIWIHVYPKGLRKLLKYTKQTYDNPTIYITENGIDQFDFNGTLTFMELLNDSKRTDYYSRHVHFLQRAIEEEGVNVKGYFAWSLLDNFEWASGYTMRYGINLVDFKDGLKRYPKKSALWFKNFLQK